MFQKICNLYARILTGVMMVLGISLLLAVAIQVAGRYVPFVPRYLWPLEVTNFSLIWVVFIGSVLALRDNKHFNVDVFLGKKLNPAFYFFLRILYYFVLLSVSYIFITDGYRYFINWGLIQVSDITGMNLGWLYFSVPFAGISWLLFLIENIVSDVSKKSKDSAVGGNKC